MCPAGIIGSLDENSVDLKKNTAGSRSNQNIIFFFWPGVKKKYGGEGGVSGYDMWKYAQNH